MTAEGQATRLGAILRLYGLDELPQLVNVVRGEMSIVGPRPVMAPDCSREEPRRFRRFEINPGMTGLWAMCETDWAYLRPYISPDEMYRKCWSVRLDLAIVMRSLGAALAAKGH
jgi:lipopolysaccharide/colanic/teichoic acid biosynthesis glycosyltransferase